MNEYTKKDIVKIAIAQKKIIGLLAVFLSLFIILSALIKPFVMSLKYAGIFSLTLIMTISVTFFMLCYIVKLIFSLRYGLFLSLIWCLGMFIPGINLMILALLFEKGTSVIRDHGLKVGFFGARKKDIQALNDSNNVIITQTDEETTEELKE